MRRTRYRTRTAVISVLLTASPKYVYATSICHFNRRQTVWRLTLLRRGVRDGSLRSLPNMAVIQRLAYGAPHYLNGIDKTLRANPKAAACLATIESSYLKTPSVLLCNHLVVLDSCTRFGSRHTSKYLFDEYTDSHLCEKFGLGV